MENLLASIVQGSAVSKSRRFKTTIHPHRYGSTVFVSKGGQFEDAPKISLEDERLLREYTRTADYERAVKHAALSQPRSITLTKGANLQSGRRRRGRGGLSRRSQTLIKADLATMERMLPVGSIGFFTATVPNLEYQALDAVMRNWGRVVKNFKQRLRDHLGRLGKKLTCCYVTEIQRSRYRKTGLPINHLHLAFRCRENSNGIYWVTHEQLRRYWVDSLNSVTDDQPFYMAITDVQVVEKSLVNYLSKYMSKEASAAQDVAPDECPDWCPTSWWGSTRNVKRRRESFTIRGMEDLSDYIARCIRAEVPDMFVWYAQVNLDLGDGNQIPLGWVYEVTEETYRLLVQGKRPYNLK